MSRRAFACLVLVLLCVAPLPRLSWAACCVPVPKPCCGPDSPCCDPGLSVEPNDAWARAEAPSVSSVAPGPNDGALDPVPLVGAASGRAARDPGEARPRSTHPPPRASTPVTLAVVLLR